MAVDRLGGRSSPALDACSAGHRLVRGRAFRRAPAEAGTLYKPGQDILASSGDCEDDRLCTGPRRGFDKPYAPRHAMLYYIL